MRMKDRLYAQRLVTQEQALFSYVFMFLLFHTQFISHVSGVFFVHQFIEEKLVTNWKNWENKNIEFVSS